MSASRRPLGEPRPSPSPSSGTAAALRRLAGSGRARNVVFSGADHVLLLALWAASTPIFIAELGAELFGLWILINAVVGLGGVFSLGLGEATVRFVAKYLGAGRRDLAARVVETTLTLYGAVGVVAGVAVAVAAPAIAAGVLDVAAADRGAAVDGLGLAGLALVVTSVLKVFEAAVNGAERFDVTARVNMAARSFIILANVAAVLAGHGLATLMTLTVLGLAGQALILQRLVAVRFLPEVRWWRGPSRAVVGEVVRFGAHGWLQITAGALSTIVDRFLVGALVTPAAAGVYAVCMQLSQQIHLLLVRALAFLMPAASAAGRGDTGRLATGYGQGAALTLAVIGAVAVPLYVLAPQVLTVWIGAAFAADGAITLRLLVIYFAVKAAGVVPFFLLNGVGRPGWNTVGALLHGVAVVAVMGLVLPVNGLDGAGWARLAALPTLVVVFGALLTRVLPGARQATALFGGGIAAALVLGAGVALWSAAAIGPHLGELAVAVPALGLAGLAAVAPFAWRLRHTG